MLRYSISVFAFVFLVSSCSHQEPAPVFDATDLSNSDLFRNQNSSVRLRAYLEGWRGVPYRNGGLDRKGIDCSGLVYRTFKDLYGIELPRATKYQSRVGTKITMNSLRSGDLVFFKTGLLQRHVGIYVGKQRFVHASYSLGVTIDSLQDPYWENRYWKSKRLPLPASPSTM